MITGPLRGRYLGESMASVGSIVPGEPGSADLTLPMPDIAGRSVLA